MCAWESEIFTLFEYFTHCKHRKCVLSCCLTVCRCNTVTLKLFKECWHNYYPCMTWALTIIKARQSNTKCSLTCSVLADPFSFSFLKISCCDVHWLTQLQESQLRITLQKPDNLIYHSLYFLFNRNKRKTTSCSCSV